MKNRELEDAIAELARLAVTWEYDGERQFDCLGTSGAERIVNAIVHLVEAGRTGMREGTVLDRSRNSPDRS